MDFGAWKLWIRKLCPLFALGAILAGASAIWFLVAHHTTNRHRLSITVGEELGFRHEMAVLLKTEAAKHGLALDLRPFPGWKAALEQLSQGKMDVAVVHGGTGFEHVDLSQVTRLRSEPLHLMVKPEVFQTGLPGLKGKRINLGPPDSETHVIAKKVLDLMGFRSGIDYQESHFSFVELNQLSRMECPEAIFASAPVPWPLGKELVKRHSLRLLELPFSETLSLQVPGVENFRIPGHTYRFDPPVPAQTINTLATSRIVVANRATPPRAIRLFMKVLYESEFTRVTQGKLPVPEEANKICDYPLHAGAIEFLHRNDPLLDNDLKGKVGDLGNALMSAGSAFVFLITWWRSRKGDPFSPFLTNLADLELEVLQAGKEGTLSTDLSQAFSKRLLCLELDILKGSRDGVLNAGEPMQTFWARADRVRQTLDWNLRQATVNEALPFASVRAGSTRAA